MLHSVTCLSYCHKFTTKMLAIDIVHYMVPKDLDLAGKNWYNVCAIYSLR